ncbi:type II secretion system F family protein [Clostridium sp. MSJ-11]|uniref:Type II secretion system F family protein n=1 Tax=Clostridium mobile TaxID=2841512 RepID=A0ABS6ED65_9CLOT|nr:type II secretion system F family protein [Clostridium mobile]
MPSAIDLMQEYFQFNMNVSLKTMKDKLYLGGSFYSALKDFEKIYPKFYIEMIGVGEEAGILSKTLERLSHYYKRQFDIKKEVRKVLIYPLFLFIVTNIIISFLVVYILPQYISMLKEFKIDIPKVTSICFFVITSIYKNLYIIIPAIIISIYLLIISFKKGNQLLHKLIFKIPYIGKIYKKLQISRVFLALAFMLNSGINIVDSVEKASNTLNSILLINMFDKSKKHILRGESFSKSLSKDSLLDKKHIILISSAEEKGELPEILYKLSSMEEEEVLYSFSRAAKYIEPIIITIMSLLVGVLVFTFIFPMVNLMDSLIGI